MRIAKFVCGTIVLVCFVGILAFASIDALGVSQRDGMPQTPNSYFYILGFVGVFAMIIFILLERTPSEETNENFKKIFGRDPSKFRSSAYPRGQYLPTLSRTWVPPSANFS